MRRLLTVLAFVSPALAGEAIDAPEGWQKIFALLPPGSELKGVMLPRYDEAHKLNGVLKSRAITLVDATRIAGRVISIEFFNPDQSPKARIDLASATIYQETGLLIAKEPVALKSDRLTASGSGLYYFFDQGKGFLPGPATTVIKNPPSRP